MDEEDDVDPAAPAQSDNGTPPDVLDASDFNNAPPDVLDASAFDRAPPPDVLDASAFDHPEAESALGAGAREVAHGIGPAIASLPFMGAGEAVGAGLGALGGPLAPFTVPAGAIAGGVIGGLVGGYLGDKAQDAALDATGMNDREQRAANAEAHPIATEVGRVGSALAAFKPGALADSLVQRVLGAGVQGGLEAGQELATDGSVDPTKVGIAAVGGAIMSSPNRVGEAGLGVGRNIVGKFRPGATTGVDLPEAPAPEVDIRNAARSEPVKTSIGNAQEQAPPVENVTGVGNDSGERSETQYPKKRATRAEQRAAAAGDTGPSTEDGVTMLKEGLVDPTFDATVEKSKPDTPAVRSEGPSAQPPAAPVNQGRQPGDVAEGQQSLLQNNGPENSNPAQRPVGGQFNQTKPPVSPPVAPRNDNAASVSAQRWEQPIQGDIHAIPELNHAVKIDQQHDVPYLAGPSNDGQTIHFDPRVPTQIDVGGRMLDPRRPMAIHEVVEQHAYNAMESDKDFQALSREDRYEQAHHIATRREEAALRAQGYTPEQIKSYNSQMDALAKKTEAERPAERHPPADLWDKPYPVKQAAEMKREAARGPVSDEGAIEMARLQRAAEDNVAKRMSAEQKGEAFTPELASHMEKVQGAPKADDKAGRSGTPTAVEDNPLHNMPAEREPSHATGAKGTDVLPEPPKRSPRVLEDLTVDPREWEKLPDLRRDEVEEAAPTPSNEPGHVEDAKSIRDAAGNHVAYAHSEQLARKQTRALQIAKEIMDKFKPEREYNPNNPADLKAYRARAKEIVEYSAARFKKAAEQEGVAKYMGKKDTTPPEALWLAEQHAVVRGVRKASDGITGERELLKGEKTQVRDQRKLEGELANKRGNEFNREVTEPGNGDSDGVYHVGRVTPKGHGPDAMLRAEEQTPENGVLATRRDGKTTRVKPLRSTTLKDAMHPDDAMFVGGDFADGMHHIAREVLHQDPNVKVHILSDAEMDRVSRHALEGQVAEGFYDPNQHAIFVRDDYGPEVILHEGVHAITSHRLYNNPQMNALVAKVMQAVKAHPEMGAFFHETINPREFLAYGMTNPRFQAALAKLHLTDADAKFLGLSAKLRNGLQAFVDTVRRVMGLPEGTHNALEAVVRLTDMTRKLPDGRSTNRTFGKRPSTPDASKYLDGVKQRARAVRQEALDRYTGNKSHADVGKEMGISASRVGTLIEQAKARGIEPSNNKTSGPSKMDRGPDAMVRKIRDDADGLLKQKSAPALLRLRDMDKIARAADNLFGGADKNPFRVVHSAIERARVQSLDYAKEFGDTTGRKLVELRDSDPAEYNKLSELMQQETLNQRFGDLPLNKQGFNTNDGYKAQRDAAHPELERQWNDLGQEAKDLRDEMYQHAEQRFDEINDATADNRLEKLTGIKDPAMAKRLMEGTHTEADFKKLGGDDRERQSRMEMLQDVLSRSKIEGPYTKLGRRGGFAVIGKYKVLDTGNEVKGSPNVEDHEREFKSKADAEDFQLQQHGATKLSSYYVDKTTGERYDTVDTPVLDKKGNETFDDQGNKRMAPKEIAYAKGDPNVEQRWKASVERGYLRMHHTYRDALAHEAQLAKSGDFEKTDTQKKKYKPNIGALEMAGRFTDLENKLKNNSLYQGMGEKQRTAVKELLAEHYLQSLSGTHASNSRMKRNYVAGADDNLLKNAFDYAHETGDKLARLEHQPEIDRGMADSEKAINEDVTTSNAIRKVRNEFHDRIETMKDGGFSLASGQMSPALHRLMSWSYMARLATPGFTIRNLTQPWMMTGAELGGRHGVGASYRELVRATRDIGAGSILKGGLKDTGKAAAGKLTDPVSFIKDIKSRIKDPREIELIDRQVKDGALDPDAGFQIPEYVRDPSDGRLNMFNARRDSALTRGAENTMAGADKALHWMEEVSRSLPRAAETYNRAVTALSAYRLEYKKLLKDGVPSDEAHQKAMTYATDVTDNTQFRYTDTNKPGFQRSPFARVAFQFKQFGKSTYEFMGRHIGNAISSESDPETRKAALKSLGVMFVTHTMVAGALGLPWEPVRALLIGAKAVGIPAPDWDDVENSIRETAAHIGGDILGQTAGAKAAEAFSRGLPRLLGIDLSPGLGIDNMLLFGSPRAGSDKDMDQNLSAWLFQMIGGAPGGIALQMWHGLRDVMGGDYAGGVEKLMPVKIGSDVLKAEEGYRHGKQDSRGRTTIKPYSGYEAGVKALGLPLGREAEQNEFMHQTYQKGQEVRQGKSDAIKAFIQATTPEAKDKARQQAMAAGAKPKDLTAAVQRANSEKKRIVNGVVTTKDTKPIAQRLRDVYQGD